MIEIEKEKKGNKESEEKKYLFVVSYDTDAERKRVDYLFNNWEKGEIEKPKGLVRLVNTSNYLNLYKSLTSKIPEKNIDSYEINKNEPDISPQTISVNKSMKEDPKALNEFVEYMLSKKNAVIKNHSKNKYEVYTKKGRAEISYKVDEEDNKTNLMIKIEGFSPAPQFLRDFFNKELNYYEKRP
ncbi:MAG: hypothetical protein BTN85_2007 [Candidatus Methanohalarchaeum thermophilum]|uniref:Uncharacterized protein n=1 Tax=Methanohalarchaeum thermophilum TaxID=1903181 RepID=A0A1Q6DSQ3_METT1|nr:MAG: hypothetical protein BTN85_2007 [Candidatus Methanohalarchaeum thermophilum]